MSRREDQRLTTGQGRYTADWNLPGQCTPSFCGPIELTPKLYGWTPRALAHPGVQAVLTGDDVSEAGFKSLPNVVTIPGRNGQKMEKPPYPVLAMGRVRFVGEPVAMVVADTLAAAEDARELIDLEYHDLEP